MDAQIAEMKTHILGGKQLNMSDFYRMKRPTAVDENGVANIHVYGMLGAKWGGIYKLLGAVTDYDDLAAELVALSLDPRVKSIFLDLESGGGKALGTPEVSDVILALRETISVVAFTDTYAASACYYLGCGAELFYSSRSAFTGSIGTKGDWLTYAGFMENAGIKPIELSSSGSNLKGAGSTYREPTPEEKAFIQGSMDRTNKLFESHVRLCRAGINDEVFKGGYYSGDEALSLGLIDEITTRQEAYEAATTLAKSA